MKKNWLFLLFILFSLIFAGKCIWIGEEFWTSINSDGSFRDTKTITDFISFKSENDADDRYIAYWITPHCDGENQFEAYGEAYFADDGKICATFIDKNNHPLEVCGGFRILSINSEDSENPFEWRSICEISSANLNAAVGLNQYIARIWQNNRLQYVFGGVLLDREHAYTVGINGSVLHIFREKDEIFYCSNIELLVIRDGYVYKSNGHQHDARQHHHRAHGHIFTPDDSLSPPCAGPCNLTHPPYEYIEPPAPPPRVNIEPPPAPPRVYIEPPAPPIVYVEPPPQSPPRQHLPPSTSIITNDCDEWKLKIERLETDMLYKDRECQNKFTYYESEIRKLKEEQQERFNSDEYYSMQRENENLRQQISRQRKLESENEQYKIQISQLLIFKESVTRLEYENQRLQEKLRISESQKVEIHHRQELVSECDRKYFETEKQLKFVNEELSKEIYRSDDLERENESCQSKIKEHSRKMNDLEKQWEMKYNSAISSQQQQRYQQPYPPQYGSCNPGEINMLKQKLEIEERKNKENLAEIQMLRIKLVNIQESKILIENKLFVIQAEQKSWNQTLGEARRQIFILQKAKDCKNDNSGGFLQGKKLETLLSTKDDLIIMLKESKKQCEKQFEKINVELISVKTEYANMENVLVEVEKSKKELEDERDSLKIRIETIEARCDDPEKLVERKPDLQIFAQKSGTEDNSCVIKGRRYDNLIIKLRAIFNFIQISSGLNVAVNFNENNDDSFIKVFDGYILRAFNATKLEVETLKLQQQLCASDIDILKNDVKILRHSQNEEASDDGQSILESGQNSAKTKLTEISNLRALLNSYELETKNYRSEISKLKFHLKNYNKVRNVCKNTFRRLEISQNSSIIVFERFENSLFSTEFNFNRTRNEFYELKQIISNQTTLIKSGISLLRGKRAYETASSSISYDEDGGEQYEYNYEWKSGDENLHEESDGYEYGWKSGGVDEDISEEDANDEDSEYRSVHKKIYHESESFTEEDENEDSETRQRLGTCKSHFEKLEEYQNDLAAAFNRFENYILAGSLFYNETRSEFYRLKQAFDNQTWRIKNEFSSFLNEESSFNDNQADTNSEITLKYNTVIQKLRSIYNVIQVTFGFNFAINENLDDENFIEDFNNIILQTLNTSRLENEALKAERQLLTTEINLVKNNLKNLRQESEGKIDELKMESKKLTKTLQEKCKNGVEDGGRLVAEAFISESEAQENFKVPSDDFQEKITTTNNNDVILRENDATIFSNEIEETYKILRIVQSEISSLQKDLCDYQQKNSDLRQSIVEKDNEMKKLRDLDALHQTTISSLNETIEKCNHVFTEKEVESESLKRQIDIMLPEYIRNENQTLTKQIESMLTKNSECNKNDDNNTAKLHSLLQDLLVMLKRNKEKCEERFLDQIKSENHIIKKRNAPKGPLSKKIPAHIYSGQKDIKQAKTSGRNKFIKSY